MTRIDCKEKKAAQAFCHRAQQYAPTYHPIRLKGKTVSGFFFRVVGGKPQSPVSKLNKRSGDYRTSTWGWKQLGLGTNYARFTHGCKPQKTHIMLIIEISRLWHEKIQDDVCWTLWPAAIHLSWRTLERPPCATCAQQESNTRCVFLLIDISGNFISQEALQAHIKLNACHCDKGFSNQLCTKACKPQGRQVI